MRIIALGFLGAALAALVAGCVSPAPGSSTITGTIDQASFPAPVSSISVISDSSAPTTAPVAADGKFSLSLTEGASYRFTLGADGIPLILRNDGDRLQTMIKITGGDASTDIGSVRFWGGVADSSASGASGSATRVVVPTTDPTASDTCVDGVIARTMQPCSTGAAEVTCVDNDDHHAGMGEHHHGGHGGPGAMHGGPPPEAVASFDVSTDASPKQAVAIPERTLATGIGCGGCPGM